MLIYDFNSKHLTATRRIQHCGFETRIEALAIYKNRILFKTEANVFVENEGQNKKNQMTNWLLH